MTRRSPQHHTRCDRWGTIAHYAGANVRAVAVWALIAPFVITLLFVVLRPVLRRVKPG